jgi:hypothetical protein
MGLAVDACVVCVWVHVHTGAHLLLLLLLLLLLMLVVLLRVHWCVRVRGRMRVARQAPILPLRRYYRGWKCCGDAGSPPRLLLLLRV